MKPEAPPASPPPAPRPRRFVAARLAFALAALACATPPRAAEGQPLRSRAAGYELELLVDGRPVPTFAHAGETYAEGELGARYTLRVWNRTGRRIEAVVAVDGRDAIDGGEGDFRRKRGYLVPAYGHVDVEGWRLDAREAAAFRFSRVRDSYAAKRGSARHVGVVGVAIFPERPPRIVPPIVPRLVAPVPQSPRAEAERAEEGAPASPASAAPADAAEARSGAAPRPGAAGARADAGPEPRRSAARRPGLGTEFGEALTAPIEHVPFVRARPSTPAALLGVRYDDRAGLVALGIDVDGALLVDEAILRGSADPFPASRGYAPPPPGWRR